MSVIVSKTKTESVNVSVLQSEINVNANIVPSCLSITNVGTNYDIEFAAALSGAEDTELDTVLSAHVPPTETISVTALPFSTLDQKKLAVHPSYKPLIDGITTYAVWTGSGDEVDGNGDLVDDGLIGGGPLLHFDMITTESIKQLDVKFHSENGRVWLHEAYIKFTNAPEKCYITGYIVAMATPLQQAVSKDLNVDGDGWITYAGVDLGSDGFADPDKIVLVPRTFSHDGDWNYDGTNLTPAAGDGEYKMTSTERRVHRFVHRIPMFGSCPYFSITSDETTELPANYFIQIICTTTDDSNFVSAWHASVLLEIYRQRTYKP
jgi:hypothetical protein